MREKDTPLQNYTFLTLNNAINQLNAGCFISWYNWQIQWDQITTIFRSLLKAVNWSFKRNEKCEDRARRGQERRNTFECFAWQRERDDNNAEDKQVFIFLYKDIHLLHYKNIAILVAWINFDWSHLNSALCGTVLKRVQAFMFSQNLSKYIMHMLRKTTL